MAQEKIPDTKFYVVHDATKNVGSGDQKEKVIFHTVSNFHLYNSKEEPGKKCWHIRYKKTTKKEFPEIEVFDSNIVLGALLTNYQVRCKAMGHHLSGDSELENEKPGLLRPENAHSIVWNGVDIKAVYGQDHFVLPDTPLTQEQLRQIGLEAQQKLDAWVANGGVTTGTAKEAVKALQSE